MSTAPPNPSFSFTIPSLHDDIDLDCRIYNPPHSAFTPSSNETLWIPRGAVVAHPYAPLGGCYDDPIVLVVVEECLKKGLVVATFNFRGAPGSKSSTSWTTKPEVNDYISVAGMLIHYLSTISSSLSCPTPPSSDHLTPVPSNTLAPPSPSIKLTFPTPSSPQHIHLLLSGYSYGSLITTLLPPISTLLAPFTQTQSPNQPQTTATEILARAHNLAHQTLKDLSHPLPRGRNQSQIALIGGEEAPPGTRLSRDHSRKSLDIAVRRSLSHTRHSLDRSRQRLFRKSSGSRGGSRSSTTADGGDTPSTPPSPSSGEPSALSPAAAPVVHTSHLLISPLLGSIAGMATLSVSTLVHSLSPFSRSHAHAHPAPNALAAQNLTQSPTLVVYGTNDAFTSAKKVRRWCEGLGQDSKGAFEWLEVQGAGHFWREKGVLREMRGSVEEWLGRVVEQ